MKRARNEEDQVDPSISMPGRQMEVWNNAPLMHQNIASYLHRFADFMNLAMTTKRLYAFFCEHDETVQCYHTFGTSAMAQRFFNANQRRNHLIESAIPRCIDFVWQRDCDVNLKSDMAEEIIYRTATRGVLGIFRRYAAWVRPEKQAFLYRHLIAQMAKSGCDNQLCLFYTQSSYWLPTWKPTQNQFEGIFSAVAANALRVPNFYALLYQQCLTILKHLNAPNRILQISTLISVIGANTFDPEAVRHFWKPEYSGQVFHDCCLAATRQAVIEDAAVDPPFYERASIRLAWVAQTFLSDKVTITTDPTRRLRKQWRFSADPDIQLPEFQFVIVCIKYHRERHEGDIIIDFQMDEFHLRLHGTVPWQYSGFDGEGLGSDAETR